MKILIVFFDEIVQQNASNFSIFIFDALVYLSPCSYSKITIKNSYQLFVALILPMHAQFQYYYFIINLPTHNDLIFDQKVAADFCFSRKQVINYMFFWDTFLMECTSTFFDPNQSIVYSLSLNLQTPHECAFGTFERSRFHRNKYQYLLSQQAENKKKKNVVKKLWHFLKSVFSIFFKSFSEPFKIENIPFSHIGF